MNPSSIADVLACLDPQVWLVTAQDGARRSGYIATSVTNLSIVPGMHRLLISLAHSHFTYQLIEPRGAFALHLLGEDQLDWVWRFGLQSGRDQDKLAGLACRTAVTGCPIVAGVVGWLDCQVEAKLDIGERTLYVGEVVDGHLEAHRQPLRWQRARELAAPERLAQLKAQTEHQAAEDADMIRAWRHTHCG